jgi:hypothetical protein
MAEGDVMRDRRGRRRRAGRLKHSDIEKQRVIKIREQLERQEGAPIGSKAVKLEYKSKFGQEISEWFINRTIKEHKEAASSQQKGRLVGDYILEDYAARKLKRFGKVIMSLDFMGMKQVKGVEAPTYFLCSKYIHPQTLGIVSQISARTGDEVIRILKYIWRSYIKPDLVKLNYNSAFGANASHQGCMGKLPIFMLNLGIIPFYVPTPETVGTVDLESFSCVFSEPLCRLLWLRSPQEIDFKIENFYLEYRRRSDSNFEKLKVQVSYFKSIFADVDLENREVNNFMEHKVLFLKMVEPKREGKTGKYGVIKVLSTVIKLGIELINSVVLCKLDLKKKNYLSTVRVPRGNFSWWRK